MKILYGVQGTGNGHLTRARIMARHLKAAGVQVDFLFSGRDPSQYFSMACFGDYRGRRGLTFVAENGRVDYLRSVLRIHPVEFIRDVMKLDLGRYDAVVTDFEPISSWAGRMAGVPVIGMGHQYAFRHGAVPRDGENWQSRFVMRHFAPADIGLGLHWDSFGAPVLPPIIDTRLSRTGAEHVLVYLPFENPGDVTRLLQQFPHRRFVQYGGVENEVCGNVVRRQASVAGFHRDLARAAAVICNTGFELISECLHIGVPVLTRPVARQSEQLSNAVALRQLQLAAVAETLTADILVQFLGNLPSVESADYPDVAAEIVGWIWRRDWHDVDALARRLWQPRRQRLRSKLRAAA